MYFVKLTRVYLNLHLLTPSFPTQLDSDLAYVEQLRHDPKEVNALLRDLLINGTNFFRDGSAFETLAQLVIPKLFDGRGPDDTVRIWVPGCATGEEAYSIAMLLRAHMAGWKRVTRVQIFATDIRSEEHPSELQSLMPSSSAVFWLTKKRSRM